jgi:hypothetical protein
MVLLLEWLHFATNGGFVQPGKALKQLDSRRCGVRLLS